MKKVNVHTMDKNLERKVMESDKENEEVIDDSYHLKPLKYELHVETSKEAEKVKEDLEGRED